MLSKLNWRNLGVPPIIEAVSSVRDLKCVGVPRVGMDTPETLERQVHRIHELLERSHDNVTWNDHIPDPDNPSQLRQIALVPSADTNS
jgi:hypothetical protein